MRYAQAHKRVLSLSLCEEDIAPPSKKKRLGAMHAFSLDPIYHIFTFCCAEELGFVIPLVCKRWNKVAEESKNTLWKQLSYLEWPILKVSVEASFTTDWQKFYCLHRPMFSPVHLYDQSNTLINLSLRLQVPKQQLKHIFSEISSISQKEIERTNKIDKYMKRQHKYLHYYSKIREIQASNIELRLEELFLSWFRNMETTNMREEDNDVVSVHDSCMINLLGPSGNAVVVHILFSTQLAQPMGETIDASTTVEITSETESNEQPDFHVQLIDFAPKECELHDTFLMNLTRTREYMGLRHLNNQQFWNYLFKGYEVHHSENQTAYSGMMKKTKRAFQGMMDMSDDDL